jgi:antibiotic biosynthesis monooxygenase (ABM) superfamily enzyme
MKMMRKRRVDPITAEDADTDGPVTLVITRCVRPGRETAYQGWLAKLQSDVRKQQPGYLGVMTQRPGASAAREYVSAVRFDSLANLRAFETSDLLSRALREVAELVEAPAERQRVTGFELWFQPPSGTVPLQPSRGRMAVLMTVVVFVLVLTIGTVITAVTTRSSPSLTYPVRLLVTVAIQVTIMTYWLMPYLTRRLARWIYPPQRTRRARRDASA